MSNGTFTDFMNALRNYESGVDYANYRNGDLTEARIIEYTGADNWADYQSGKITWTELQYHAHNDLGFVGYQFGEALMIDLGYYQDTSYYMHGEETNLWDGAFTGKNGIYDLADLESGLQESVILDEFGYNLTTIESMLTKAGTSLADFLGKTETYNDGGHNVTVTLTFTGILAAAHLRGADSVVDLLLHGETSQDEYGTSILQYVQQFGGFDTIDEAKLIDAFKSGTSMSLAETVWQRDFDHDGKIAGAPASDSGNGGTDWNGHPFGDDNPSHPLNPPGGQGGQNHTGSDGSGTEYHLDWNWGQHVVINFDPAHDTLDFSKMSEGDFQVYEDHGSVVIDIPTNHESYTLHDVTLAELDMTNFHGLDSHTQAFWDHLV